MFLRLETQWRIGFAGRTGLDYPAVRCLLDLYAVEDARSMMEEIMIMEREALKIFIEAAD